MVLIKSNSDRRRSCWGSPSDLARGSGCNWREPLFYPNPSLFQERKSGRVTPIDHNFLDCLLATICPRTPNARVILQARRGYPVGLYQVHWSKCDVRVMMDTAIFGKTETGRGARLPFECPQTDRVRDGRYPCGTFILDLINNNNACWQALQTVDLHLFTV
jgi:hypothetical protein